MLLLSTYVTGPEGLSRLVLEDVPDNTDDFPYLEYALLLAGPLDTRDFAANLEMLIPYFDPLESWLAVDSLDPKQQRLLRKTRDLMTELFFIRKDSLMGRTRESEAGLLAVIKKFKMKKADLELIQPFLGY